MDLDLFKLNKEAITSEEGSLSLLIIGFFLAALMAAMLITNVAVVASAKRSLDHATEAAAMRAVHNLNEKAYYSGKHTALTSVWGLLNGGAVADNRVPVDCEKGLKNVQQELNSWIQSMSSLKTMQISSYKLQSFQCIYDKVYLETSANVRLPFPMPLADLDAVRIDSSIITLNQKDKGFYLFGMRIN